jgi:uncharacterized LabA/DUF88 family protein
MTNPPPFRTAVYVDAFNLYFGCLKGTPYKWLNLLEFARLTYPLPRNEICLVRYFTARVKARPNDPMQPIRQNTYLRALETIPNLSIHEGHYLETHPVMRLLNPPTHGSPFVQVIKTEEKGSDVNLAAHMLVDGFRDRYDVAVVLSNDSDLVEPIRLVRNELQKRVLVLFPCSLPGRKSSIELKRAASRADQVQPALLQQSQFPDQVIDSQGRTITKPTGW